MKWDKRLPAKVDIAHGARSSLRGVAPGDESHGSELRCCRRRVQTPNLARQVAYVTVVWGVETLRGYSFGAMTFLGVRFAK